MSFQNGLSEVLPLSGLDAKGRNGYFKGREIDLWLSRESSYHPVASIAVTVRGAKGVGNIMFELTPWEAEQLGQLLIKAAIAVTGGA